MKRLRQPWGSPLHLAAAALGALVGWTTAASAAGPELPVSPPEAEVGRALAPPSWAPVGHRDLLDQATHRAPLPPGYTRPAPSAWANAEVPGPIVSRDVMGYLPYWEMDYSFPRWEMLTYLAWFAVAMDSDGDITNFHGWGGDSTANLVAEAHAHGVKVLVTITNFDGGSIGALLGSATARSHAIDTCLGLMATHGADGVNIDFEFVPSSAKANFVTFMTDLKLAVLAAQPNGWEGHVSLAGPAIDWSGAYDYDQLLAGTDGIMVMAYGYHWSGSGPGPISPLFAGDLWGTHSIAWTIDDYLTYGGQENRHKVLIGLPFYGRDWKVADTTVPGVSLGAGSSVVYTTATAEAAAQGSTWEDVSKSPYYHINRSDGLYQVWYDDGASFAEKVGYVDELDLGGIGIWALGYDGTLPDLWDGIASVLVPPPPAPDGGAEPGPEPGPEVGPEVGPEAAVEPPVEPVVEPVVEPAAEVGPEPGPEANPESTSDDVPASQPDGGGSPQGDAGAPSAELGEADASTSDTATGGASVWPGGPISGAHSLTSYPADDAGCAGAPSNRPGHPARPVWLVFLALALGLAARRARRRARA